MHQIRRGLVAAFALLLSAGDAGARVWIADEETGLVFGMTMFRHPMEEKVFKIYNADGQLVDRDMTNQRPFDFESIHIFKIQKAEIHDIEAMGISLPLHSKNGWSDFWR